MRAGEIILGDGSYTITLEKRGYVLSNAWTPESAVEHPDAVRNLAMEYARAGGDVTQTYTFFSDDKRLKEWHGPDIPSVRAQNYFFLNNYEMIYHNVPYYSANKSIIPHAKLPKRFHKKKVQ